MIAVQHQPTARAHMGTHRQTFLYPLTTARTILTGEAGRDGYNRDTMQTAIVAHPAQEQPPTGITDALGEMLVLDQVGDLKRFIGNQIARFDQRTRLLASEVFTLPGNSQIPSGKAFDGL